jgi:hypothetical protein
MFVKKLRPKLIHKIGRRSDMIAVANTETVDRLSAVYEDIDDVDLVSKIQACLFFFFLFFLLKTYLGEIRPDVPFSAGGYNTT